MLNSKTNTTKVNLINALPEFDLIINQPIETNGNRYDKNLKGDQTTNRPNKKISKKALDFL